MSYLYGTKPPTKSYVELLFMGNPERVMYLAEQYKGDAKWYEAYSLTPALLRLVVNKYAYYSHNGQSIAENAGHIVADIKKETGVLLNTQKVANAIGTMDMAMISFAKKEPKHTLVYWWRTGQGGTAYVATTATKKVVNTTARTAGAVLNIADDVLPWYLKPKTVAVGAVGVGLVYLFLPRLAQTAIASIKQARKK